MVQPRASTSVVCFLIATVHLCSCMRYDNYNEYALENERFCHPLNKKHSHDVHNSTATIVRSHHMFDSWIVKRNLTCMFTFKIARNEGIFAVIQRMSFRQNGNQCLDYVRFKRTDGHHTEKLCGKINHQTTYFPIIESEDNLHNMNDTLLQSYDKYAEFDPIRKWKFPMDSEFETEIFISKERLLDGENLDLSIVYTPYRNCKKLDPERFKPVGRNLCIRKEYLCDMIYNCPFGICSDEINCSYIITDRFPKNDTATKVTVGAVTTMILCFIIFIMCLWICKKSRKLCWSSDCAGPNMCSRPNSLPDTDGGLGSNRAVPTAPMLEVAVSSPVANKDLPPSYDSLFPEHSNPARL
ncbi:hypothetical protein EAG_15907 [Camponotus floridanus]|uniref:Uncharacterized protein n=1 Tax=Camponotus floridanus TaxID=104421 RepID=E2AU17_CAMFO|nr:uncharacterized protein LOC105256019 [Camponotus floridanus]EFN63060.1 hypothetical protein EAG_15907 [Camponotus floridanus]